MKHHKRRIVQPQLAQSIHGALADGGAWRIATDIEDYALHVHEVMDGRTDFRNAGTIAVSLPTGHVGKGNAELADDMPHADFTESERFDDRVLTNFEKKGLAAPGHPRPHLYRGVTPITACRGFALSPQLT